MPYNTSDLWICESCDDGDHDACMDDGCECCFGEETE